MRLNKQIQDFMENYKFEGITFDDVSLETRYADFLPAEANVKTKFSRNIHLNIPFVSAAMDTVTESEMAIAMALAGGIGVVHKNLRPAAQAAEVAKVKHYLNGLITDAITFRKDMKVCDILAIKERKNYKFSGFPIVDDNGCLVGIFTARDGRFLTDFNVKVSEVMTTDLVTAEKGTNLKQAFETMIKSKLGKLPIVDDKNRLVGLYSFSDVRGINDNIDPYINRDEHHQLRVAAAVGPYEEERCEVLIKAGVDALVIDTAHGHSKGVIETLKLLKKKYPNTDIIAGNIATAEAGRALVDAGADAVKVGIGPGSICTTRVVAGVGVPQVSAVYRIYKEIGNDVPIIADGGITYSGDVAKALCVGAGSVMMGSALAGTDESPGERILHQGRTFVAYRGMGSLDAMKQGKGSRERYGQSDVNDPNKLVPQGIEGLVPYRGRVNDVIHQFVGGVRYSFGYVGARNLQELRENARFVRVTSSGLQEAHPHDVKVIKDAPNYQTR